MPYVQRDHTGKIIGLYAQPQPRPDGASLTEPDPLAEDHPDVAAFRAEHPLSDDLLKPLTEEDVQRTEETHKRLAKEHEDLRNAIWIFNQSFSELEIALSALLYEALNIQPRSSHLAYAIYYSPNGFDARADIVANVIQQLVSENPALADLQPVWADLFKGLRGPRIMRNKIAHATPITLSIHGKSHVRLTAPVFDAIRVGRHITETGQPPGLEGSEIRAGAKNIRMLIERIDGINRLFLAFRAGDPTLPRKLAALSEGPSKPDNR